MDLSTISRSNEFKSGALYSLFVVVYSICSMLIGFILLFTLNEENSTYLSFFSYTVSTLVVYAVYKKKINERLIKNKFRFVFLPLSILVSVAMLFGFGFINLSFSTFLESVGVTVSNVSIDLSSFQNYILCVITLCIAPAIFEEITFRGILLNGVSGNVIVGSILSALCFSLYHLSLSQFIYQFIYGFCLSILVIKTGNLIFSIIAHFLNNFIIISVEYFNITLNLFSPIIIACGLGLFGVFIFFTLIYKVKESKNLFNKVKALDFTLGASVGLVFCVLMMVGVAFG